MGGDDRDGYYCTICGGIPSDKISVKRLLVNGKETGIDRRDWIIAEVRKLKLSDDTVITEELLKRTKALNHVPTKLAGEYGDALLNEYKKQGA